jgi:organic hydroperoxide reductase OsmC/OhrA
VSLAAAHDRRAEHAVLVRCSHDGHTTITPKSFTYRTSVGRVEGRSADLHCEGKPLLRVSGPPEFKGESGLWTPENLFVAAVEVCLMLTFVGIAEKRGLKFATYESRAEGLLEWQQGSYRFTRVIVSPTITFFDEQSIPAAREIIERAHDTCLIARSLNCEVIVEPCLTVNR